MKLRTLFLSKYLLLAKGYLTSAYNERQMGGYVPSIGDWLKERSVYPIELERGSIRRYATELELQQIINSIMWTDTNSWILDFDEYANFVSTRISGSGHIDGPLRIFSVDEEKPGTSGILHFEANFLNGIAHGDWRVWDEHGGPRTAAEMQFGLMHGTQIIYDKNNNGSTLSEVSCWRRGQQHGAREKFHDKSCLVKTRSNYVWGQRVGPQHHYTPEEGERSTLLTEQNPLYPDNAWQERAFFDVYWARLGFPIKRRQT